MRTRRHSRGYTLTETLLSVAVVGVGLSLAGPGLGSLVSDNRQAATVNQLVGTLHLARSEAITRNVTVSVCASGDGDFCDSRAWESGWIAFLDRDADRVRDPAEDIVDRGDGSADLRIRSNDYPQVLSFSPAGRPAAPTSGEFLFCPAGAPTASRVVLVRPTGQPALAVTHRDGSPARCSAG
jgi:type IV fimbrial biogenesis protein FimT